ncbi:Major Facilitator Superfamily protein [compost metagenome]
MLVMSVVFGILMYAAPMAMQSYGAVGFNYVELALITFLGSAVVLMPKADFGNEDKTGEVASDRKINTNATGVPSILLAVFALFASQGLAWTFAASAAQTLEISPDVVGIAFTVCALAQIPAAGLATWMGMRLGYRIPISISLTLLCFISIGMYCIDSQNIFLLSTGLFSAAAAFAFPYMQSILAELDTTGSSAAIGGAMISIGAAAGPAIGGFIFDYVKFQGVGWVCALLVVVSILSSIAAAAKHNRLHSTVFKTEPS